MRKPRRAWCISRRDRAIPLRVVGSCTAEKIRVKIKRRFRQKLRRRMSKRRFKIWRNLSTTPNKSTMRRNTMRKMKTSRPWKNPPKLTCVQIPKKKTQSCSDWRPPSNRWKRTS